MGLNSTIMMASSIHPMGLRGRRTASNVPTAVTGTAPAAVRNASATGPPVPGWWVRLSSTTEATASPSTSTPSTTAATGAVRAREIVLTGMLPFLDPRDEPTLGAPRPEIVTGPMSWLAQP